MRLLLLYAVVSISVICSRAQQLTPVWVEAGENGAAFARVVVASESDCPSIVVDGVTHTMTPRIPVLPRFMPACEAAIPAGARSASVKGRSLKLPKPDPSRIVVFGDTGCRIKADEIQNCNDPAEWPFARVSARAAAAKPDLIIHVGDYLYREDKCPSNKLGFCGGTPNGDTWNAWNADFFTPAAKLLAAAPWVFSRGNHENCERSWRGWFYYLDPHAWRGDRCEAFQEPYLVRLGALELVMFDSSAATNNMSHSDVERYAGELISIHARHAWLVAHHPFWGFAGGGSSLAPANRGLQQAWEKARPQGVDLIVSGHVHLFELLSFDGDVPPALVAGQGGTDLAKPIETPLVGTRMDNVKVVAGRSEHQFGYTMVTRESAGWHVALTGVDDRVLAECDIRGWETSCLDTKR